jgi:hypothetical protein
MNSSHDSGCKLANSKDNARQSKTGHAAENTGHMNERTANP